MSWCNTKWKHVFIHIPKSAGTSMERFHFVGGNAHHTVRWFLKNKEVPENFIWWAFVRHPADRLYSAYFSGRISKWDWKCLKEGVNSFEEYVLDIHARYERMPHTQPMWKFVLDKDGNCPMDFLGRFENLEEDWKKISEWLGFPRKVLPKRNPSDHPHWTTVYTPEMKEIVKEVYRKDFELWYPEEW